MKFTKYLSLALRGCAMGTADVVPGVSGGTIAFITGIYTELLESIRSVNGTAFRLFLRGRFRELWQHINGSFLLSVGSGIAVAIFSLAHLMTYLLEEHPIAIWSLFFGLIIASSIMVARQITRWSITSVLSLIVGIAVAWWITIATPTETPDAWWFIMIAGAIAICAMILPGISGSFILLLLGKYEFLMEAVGNFDIAVLAIFMVGAVAGITSFSHLLTWLLKSYNNITVALLMGFMIGSLNKIWAWKVIETQAEGDAIIESTRNVLPSTFEAVTGEPALLGLAIGFCVLGFSSIFIIEGIAKRLNKSNR